MIQIFEKMMSKDFDESMMLSKAYALIHDLNPSWVVCDDCTIKEQCHRICDELEKQGFDLDSLPVHVIKEKFADITFQVEYPKEYLELQETLKFVEKQKIKLQSFSHHSTESIELIDSHIKMIKDKIKAFND